MKTSPRLLIVASLGLFALIASLQAGPGLHYWQTRLADKTPAKACVSTSACPAPGSACCGQDSSCCSPEGCCAKETCGTKSCGEAKTSCGTGK